MIIAGLHFITLDLREEWFKLHKFDLWLVESDQSPSALPWFLLIRLAHRISFTKRVSINVFDQNCGVSSYNGC